MLNEFELIVWKYSLNLEIIGRVKPLR